MTKSKYLISKYNFPNITIVTQVEDVIIITQIRHSTCLNSNFRLNTETDFLSNDLVVPCTGVRSMKNSKGKIHFEEGISKNNIHEESFLYFLGKVGWGRSTRSFCIFGEGRA